jgi:hypothetical protein
MAKKIQFIPDTTGGSAEKYDEIAKDNLVLVDKPQPMRLSLPDWYTKSDLFNNGDRFANNMVNSLTFKACLPFMDALTFGYSLVTPTDIQVSWKAGVQRFSWKGSIEPIIQRDSSNILPTPIGCSNEHYAWNSFNGIILPEGYSAIITHPMNRHDLPFVTSSGIIDDQMLWKGFFSFWVKEGWEGIIPHGTPFAQIIPFKRDEWVSERREDLIEYAQQERKKSRKHAMGWYKKFTYKRKSFK